MLLYKGVRMSDHLYVYDFLDYNFCFLGEVFAVVKLNKQYSLAEGRESGEKGGRFRNATRSTYPCTSIDFGTIS